MLQRQKLLAIFFQEFAAIFKREASIPLRQQREEKHGALPQTLQCSRNGCREQMIALQRSLDIAAQLFHAGVADRDTEVTAGHIFEFVSFVENYRARVGQDACIRLVFGLLLDRQVRKKEMMI